MAKTFTSVTEYLAAQPPEVRATLRRVRATVRKALPGAEEGISYQMPTYKLRGRAVLYFAGWKGHYSVYPVTPDVVKAMGDALKPYPLTKATVRFPLSEPVPVRLITRIAKLRAKAVAAPKRGE